MDWKRFDDGNKKAGIEGRFKAYGKTLWIQVWGTNSEEDFFGNFLAFPPKKVVGTVKVHRVWWGYSDFLVKKIPEWVGEFGCSKVYIDGHSMGGAVTQCAVSRLGFLEAHVYGRSTGGPTAGNRRFLKMIESRVGFVRFKGDLIPFLPKIPFFWIYARPEREVVLGSFQLPWKAHKKTMFGKEPCFE